MNVLSRTVRKTLAGALSLGLILPSLASAQVVRLSVEAGVAAEAGRAGVAGAVGAPSLAPLSPLGAPGAPLLAPSFEISEAVAGPVLESLHADAWEAVEDMSFPATTAEGKLSDKFLAASNSAIERFSIAAVARAKLFGAAQAAAQGRLNEIFENQAARRDLADSAVLPGPILPRRGFAFLKRSGAPAPVSDEVGAALKAMHKAYEQAAAKRLADLQAKAAQFKSGRFTAELKVETSGEKTSISVIPIVDGQPLRQEDLESGKVSAEEYAEFKKAVKPLVVEMRSVLDQNEKEHADVHARMKAHQQQAVRKKVQAIVDKGADLQSWGVPEVISINQEKRLRYAHLYRMGGMPTTLGRALHMVMAPMVAKDPAFLSQVTQGQLHAAVQFLHDSLRYGTDIESDDFQKAARLGLKFDEGYDYAEWRKAFVDKAILAFSQKQRGGGDVNAGLGMRPKEQQPAVVLRQVLKDLLMQIQDKIKSGAKPADLKEDVELMTALHATLGIPMPVSSDQMGMVSVQHSQLPRVLAELRRRQVHSSVMEAVIRSFPLGESLLRLGVAGLWERGVTGKGVKVAVIDNGVDFNHPEFIGVKSYSENLTRDRGDHTRGGHATPMASILHAIAPDAEIQSYQVLSNTELPGVMLNMEEMHAAVLKAMDRAAENGAQVLSMSLGFPIGYGNGAFARKVSELKAKGIAVVVSAGNSGDELPNGLQVGSPGSAPEAITVGAVDYHGDKAYFSSGGNVFNPDDHSIALKPEIFTFGLNVKAAMRLPGELYQQEPVPYNYISGTSPATPHIVGVAALMLQAAKDAGAAATGALVPVSIRAALLSAVDEANKLPVLQSAEKAVSEFIKLVTGGTPQV